MEFDLDLDPLPHLNVDGFVDDVEFPSLPESFEVTEKNNKFSGNEKLCEKGAGDKSSNVDNQNFFDCHICFDLAKDPIVTCCGHLFCWPCIYQWLNVHSECPVCKGKVTMQTVTPIYGCGNSLLLPKGYPTCLGIPSRPHAKRVELRQTNPVDTSTDDLPGHLMDTESEEEW